MAAGSAGEGAGSNTELRWRRFLKISVADCTLKATRSHTTCRVALPGAQPTAEARQAPGSRPSLA